MIPRARARDERGSTLVIVLVFIVIVGVSCVATLNLAQANYKASEIMKDKASVEENAKNAIDTSVEMLRSSTSTVRAGTDLQTAEKSMSGCTDASKTLTSARSNLTGNAYYNKNNIVVLCRPDADSGKESPIDNGEVLVPPYVIETVGGVEGTGNIAGVNGEGLYDYVPFCDLGHKTSTDANHMCEAGIYLGTNAGSVYIGSNSTSKDVVWSNSSIQLESATGSRSLTLGGYLRARRQCNAGTSGGTLATGKKPTGENIDTTVNFSDCNKGGTLKCPTGGSGDGIDPATRTCDWITPITSQPDGSSLMTKVDLAALYPTCPTSGWVEMPLGRYSDYAALNTLMACSDTTFYFKPGSYYFDFTAPPAAAAENLEQATEWTAPYSGGTGDVPNNMIGGEIPKTNGIANWAGCSTTNQTLSDGTTGLCPIQPERTMQFNYDTASANVTNTEKSTKIDATESAGFATIAGSTTTQSISWKQPEPYIPERSTTKLKSLYIDIKHRETLTSYSNFSEDTNGIQTPYLEVSMNAGTGMSGTCRITIPEAELKSTAFSTSQIKIYERDATNGALPPTYACSTVNATTGWTNAMNGINGVAVNTMTAKLVVKLKSGNVMYFDGLQARVKYAGRPAPAYPAGCDTTKSGAQLIFGGTAHMYWHSGSTYMELCGRYDVNDGIAGHKYAVGIIGLHEKTAGDPTTKTASSYVESVDATKNVKFSETLASLSTKKVDSIDNVIAPATPSIGATWNDGQTAHLEYKLASDIVPDYATVTSVEIKVAHKESTFAGTPKLTIKPITGTGWSSDLTKSTNSTSWKTDTFGTWATNTGSTWSTDRSLTDLFKTSSSSYASKLNGATIQYDVPVATGADALPKSADLDGIVITITYRPEGTLRPLRKCLTTRSRLSPYAVNTTTPANGGYGMLGTDFDWAPSNSSSASDDGYIGNDSVEDAKSCALITTYSDSTPGIQFRVNGMIYAPTAAFDFSATDNEGPLFTHGLVARHLTITRWRADAGDCFGGSSCSSATSKCADRKVTLSAYSGSTEVQRTHVTIDDASCEPQTNSEAYTDWTVLRPGAS
jgi:hypothetical protein